MLEERLSTQQLTMGTLKLSGFSLSGANKDQGTRDGTTPLFIAAQKGHFEVVRFLVESSANKDQGKADDGVTPLFIAAQNGHFEVVRFLVESGASKDAAAHNGHLQVVRFLVESGASKDTGRTHDGGTPLHAAAHNGHLQVVRFLVESSANKDHFYWHRTQPEIGQRPRPDRCWRSASLLSSIQWAP